MEGMAIVSSCGRRGGWWKERIEREERSMVSRQAMDRIGKMRIYCVCSDKSSMGLMSSQRADKISRFDPVTVAWAFCLGRSTNLHAWIYKSHASQREGQGYLHYQTHCSRHDPLLGPPPAGAFF